jgi:heptosyltransferase II
MYNLKEKILFAFNVFLNRFWFKQGILSQCKSILIVKWDEIGDMATATHCFELLKKQYPEARISVLTKPFVKSLIENDPFIDEIICDIALFNKRYDLVVELRGTFATLFKSIIYGVKYRTGRAEVRFKNRGSQVHETQTNFLAIRPVLDKTITFQMPKLYYSEKDKTRVKSFLNGHQIVNFAIVHAAARRVLRQWETHKFAEVCKVLKYRYNLDIIFAGTTEDEPIINKVQEHLDFPTHAFTQGYSLSDFSCLCDLAQFYIGNESGPLHIASAYNLPLVALYGPGVPNVFYPLSVKSKVLHHVLSCNPCDQIHCVHPENPCISRIQVADALFAIEEIGLSKFG